MLILYDLARADTSEPCTPSVPTATLPAAGASDVPLETVFAVVFSDGCVAEPWRLLLAEGDGDAEELLELAGEGLVVRPPPSPLLPDTDYELQVVPSEGQVVQVNFRTGDDDLGAHEEAGRFVDVQATWKRSTGGMRVSGTLTADAPAPILQWGDGPTATDWETSRLITEPGESHHVGGPWHDEVDLRPETWCARADALEYDGTWSLGEPTCVGVALAEECGCGAGAPSAGLVTAAAATVLTRRRRRAP